MPRKRSSSAPFARLAIAGVVGASLLLTACSSGGGTASTPAASEAPSANQKPITYALNQLPTNFDPAIASDVPSTLLAYQVYEPLLEYDPAKKKYVGYLAKSWKVNDAADEFTFTLRKDVKFQDGSSLTATGVKKAIERDVAVGKGFAYLLSGIKTITAGDGVVTIQLSGPDITFLDKIALVFIPSEEALDAHASDGTGTDWFAANTAGSGPYEVQDYTAGSKLKLTKFDGYWGGWDGAHIPSITLVQADATTQALNINQGNFNVTTGMPETDVKAAESNGLAVYPRSTAPLYVLMNMASSKLADVNIRKAISLAVPYDDILKEVFLGYAKPLHGPVPDWMVGADSSIPVSTTNLKQAAELIAKAGYSTSHPLDLTIGYYSGLVFEGTVATIMKDKLAGIGINLTLKGEASWPTMVSSIGNPATRPDMGIAFMSIPTADAGSLLTASFDPSHAGPSSWQYWGYSDQATVTKLRSAGNATTLKELGSTYADVAKTLTKQYASIWLAQYGQSIVTSAKLKGVELFYSSSGMPFYKLHWID